MFSWLWRAKPKDIQFISDSAYFAGKCHGRSEIRKELADQWLGNLAPAPIPPEVTFTPDQRRAVAAVIRAHKESF